MNARTSGASRTTTDKGTFGNPTSASCRRSGGDRGRDEPPFGEQTLDVHPLVAAYQRRPDPIERLRAIQVELARDAALLGFIASHPEHYDLPEDARAVSRHIRALRKLHEVEMAELRTLGQPGPGPESAVAKKALSLLLDEMEAVARGVLPQPTADLLIGKFRKRVSDHEEIPWP